MANKNEKLTTRNKHTLSKIYLENFKGYQKRTEIKFSPGVNLIYGSNSSGKSSILQAIRLMKQSWTITNNNGLNIPFNLVLPTYLRIHGYLDFLEGFAGLLNQKMRKKKMYLGAEVIVTKTEDGEENRKFLEYGYTDKKNSHFPNLISQKWGSREYDKNGKLKISQAKVNLEEKSFSNTDPVTKLIKIEENRYRHTGPGPFGFGKKRIEKKDWKKYSEGKLDESELKLYILDDLFEVIKKDSKRKIDQILKMIEMIEEKKSSNNPYSFEPSERLLKKMKTQNKKRDIRKKIKPSAPLIFSIASGEFSCFSKKELEEIKKFITGKDFLNKEKFMSFFLKDIIKKNKFFRYSDKFLDLGEAAAKINVFKKFSKDKHFFVPSRKYEIYKVNILYEALKMPNSQLSFDGNFKNNRNDVHLTFSKVLANPALRQLPRRFLRRGMTDDFVGPQGENLGDILSESKNQKVVNEWFEKFEIPYEVSVQSNGPYHEIIMKPKKKNFVLSSRDIGLGYALSLTFFITALTQKNQIILIEEPEVHLHPKIQSKLMDLLLYSAYHNKNQFIIETHSENLLLRAQRNLRNGFVHAGKKINVDVKDILINNVTLDPDGSKVQEIKLSKTGEFKTHWKDGFFSDRLDELF